MLYLCCYCCARILGFSRSVSTEAHNYGVLIFHKNDWYQVVGHLEKCAFETNAAIAQMGTKVS